MSYRITFREVPRGDWEIYANHMGKRAEAEDSARRLKRDLREQYPRAQVAINGHRLRDKKGEADGPVRNDL